MAAELLARAICRTLREQGFASYLVGGCVRDLLLGRTPVDFDVATDARPEEIVRWFPRSGRVGAHFGVVLVRDDDAQVEVATFRSDRSYSDGRHPDAVEFQTDPREDALRRDFTINSLFLDPETGGVLDFTGGEADLRAGVIRAIGEPGMRFAEDHLRLLRAVRFAARLGFVIEPVTAAAIREAAAEIRTVSAERVREELTRILVEGGARRGFELLDDLALLPEVLPEVAAMKGVAQPPEFHPEGDVWIHTLLMLEGLREPTETLAWGVLLHDVGKPPTFRIAERIRFDGHVEAGVEIAETVLTRLRFSSDDAAQVKALIENHLRFKDAPRMKESTLRRFLRLDRFAEHLELHRLDCQSSHRRLDHYEFVRARWEALSEEQLRPALLVNGRDLIAMGYTPGPLFREVLHALEDGQLEGKVLTRAGAIQFVREWFDQHGV